jgi:hypothetical protein
MLASPSLLTSLQFIRDLYRARAVEFAQLEVQLSGAVL